MPALKEKFRNHSPILPNSNPADVEVKDSSY